MHAEAFDFDRQRYAAASCLEREIQYLGFQCFLAFTVSKVLPRHLEVLNTCLKTLLTDPNDQPRGLQQLPPTSNDTQDIQKQAKSQNHGGKKTQLNIARTWQDLGCCAALLTEPLNSATAQTKTLHPNAAKPGGSEIQMQL